MADLVNRGIYRLQNSDAPTVGVHTGRPNEFICVVPSPVQYTLHYHIHDGDVEYLGLVEDRHIQLRTYYAGFRCYYCGASCSLSTIFEWFHEQAQLDGCTSQAHAISNGPYLPLINYLHTYMV